MSYEDYKGYRLAPDINGCWDVLTPEYEQVATFPSKAAAKREIDNLTTPEQTPPNTVEEILSDFDKKCPKCYGEGHGGDGCEYCWNNNPEQLAISEAKAQLDQYYRQQFLKIALEVCEHQPITYQRLEAKLKDMERK